MHTLLIPIVNHKMYKHFAEIFSLGLLYQLSLQTRCNDTLRLVNHALLKATLKVQQQAPITACCPIADRNIHEAQRLFRPVFPYWR